MTNIFELANIIRNYICGVFVIQIIKNEIKKVKIGQFIDNYMLKNGKLLSSPTDLAHLDRLGILFLLKFRP